MAGDPGVLPTLSEPVFRSREAAIAEVVLRALKAGPPDQSQVTKEMASDFKLWHKLHFPKSVDDQDFGDADRARYEALSEHLTELAAGRAPSGNLAADLGHAVDELDWLGDRYHKGKDEDFHINPGALSRDFAKALDHVRPEDPRAAHHRERQYRAAIQALRDLETEDALDRTPAVPVAELRDGDVVLGLVGKRATGGSVETTGYLRGAPKKSRVMRGGERVPVYRVRIGDTPWEDGGREEILTVPVDALAHRFGSLDDVEIREDQQDYGLGIGQQAPEHTFDPQTDGIDYEGRARAQADRMTTITPAEDGDRAESGSATAGTGAAAPADTTAATLVPEPEAEPRAAEPSTSTPARRTVDEMPSAGAPATEPQGAPDPIGGRPAEWVKISDIAHGDLVRVDGVTKQGTARTLAGYVVGGPEPIPPPAAVVRGTCTAC
ncbi:hypothetical protein HFP70_35070 [Streptomyces sp. ARC14]|uniref:hypothetical protein n=1 Tax=Streptomyces sp. ARC14 TaxID=2724152 RepID=UPI003857BFC3